VLRDVVLPGKFERLSEMLDSHRQVVVMAGDAIFAVRRSRCSSQPPGPLLKVQRGRLGGWLGGFSALRRRLRNRCL